MHHKLKRLVLLLKWSLKTDKRYTHTDTMTLVLPNFAYTEPAAALTTPVLKTATKAKS